MTSTLSEAMLVRKGMQKLKDAFPDAWIIKTADRMTRGIPDVLAVIVHGSAVVVCCLEFKTQTGKVSGIQQITLDRLQRLADRACFGEVIPRVIRSMEDVEQLIRDITNA